MIAGDSTNFSNFSIGGRGYIFWEELNVGTVPMFKTHNIGTVPTFKMHNIGTVPTSKM